MKVNFSPSKETSVMCVCAKREVCDEQKVQCKGIKKLGNFPDIGLCLTALI